MSRVAVRCLGLSRTSVHAHHVCVVHRQIFTEGQDFASARTVSELMCAIEPDSGHNKINLAQVHCRFRC